MTKISEKKDKSIGKGEAIPKMEEIIPKMEEIIPKKEKSIAKKKAELIKSRKEISVVEDFPIINIRAIIDFVNHLLKSEIVLETDIVREFRTIAIRKINDKKLKEIGISKSSQALREEFENAFQSDPIFTQCNRFYPIKFRLINKNGNEIQLKLTDCMAKVQQLWDKAKDTKNLDELYFYFLSVLQGALEELINLIEPFNNEILSYSTDQTHLTKNITVINSMGARCISLEAKVYGTQKEQESINIFLSLSEEDQIDLFREYVKPHWILEKKPSFQTQVLELLIKNAEVQLTPEMMLALFNELTQNNRRAYISYLSNKLSGNELDILIKKDKIK